MFSLTPADPRRVELQDVERAGLQQLLEDHPVRRRVRRSRPGRRHARADAAWPRMSSGLVGSSIQARSYGASSFTQAIASPTSQR